MTVRITKAMAIEAIRTEPLLRSGSWAASIRETEAGATVGNEKDCKVCAVGAVLRDVLDPELELRAIHSLALNLTRGHAITDGGLTRGEVESSTRSLVKRGKIWNALSVLFEGYSYLKRLYTDNPASGQPKVFLDSEEIREAVCKFVEAEFPEDWEISMDPDIARPGVIKEVT